jgi:hypothetical protein
MVWPGVSSTSNSTVLPTLTIPAPRPRATSAILFPAFLCARILPPGIAHHLLVPAGMVAMLVRVQDLSDIPALVLGAFKHFT